MNAVFNHLWQSTLFAAAVALASIALRHNSPRLRYWLWLAASMKFLLPFSLIVSTGARVQFPPHTPSFRATTVQQISTYFAPVSEFPAPTRAHETFHWPLALAAIWIAGALFLLIRWFVRWRAIHIAARSATPLQPTHNAPTLASSTMLEPGIFGIIRPVLLLPEGLADTLTPEQFDAVIVHELRHLRYRDNLTAAIHMCVETIFWFHPLVWWIGAQLMAERERDYDEAALRHGSKPADYARGIVQVCEAYIESPHACAAGISGSDLKKRIRDIMTWRGSLPVTPRAKAILATAGLAAMSVPFVIGILRAQTLPPDPAYRYEVVSIHQSEPGPTPTGFGAFTIGPQGGLRTTKTSVVELLTFAYDVQNYQVIGAPGWASSEHYDVTLTPNETETAPNADSGVTAVLTSQSRNRQRLQTVLHDRFDLVLRAETRELPIYTLTQAKGGVKLSVHPEGGGPLSMRGNGPGHIVANGIPIKILADNVLSHVLGHPVTDSTGLTGQYDFKLDWMPDLDTSPDHLADTTGPSIFTALTDQLGLRLESTKGPVQVYVVEKIEHPTEN